MPLKKYYDKYKKERGEEFLREQREHKKKHRKRRAAKGLAANDKEVQRLAQSKWRKKERKDPILLARRRKYQKEYKKRNREKLRFKAAEYRRNNPEKLKESRARYYKNNKPKVLEMQEKWAHRNPEKVKAIQENYRKKHPRTAFKDIVPPHMKIERELRKIKTLKQREEKKKQMRIKLIQKVLKKKQKSNETRFGKVNEESFVYKREYDMVDDELPIDMED